MNVIASSQCCPLSTIISGLTPSSCINSTGEVHYTSLVGSGLDITLTDMNGVPQTSNTSPVAVPCGYSLNQAGSFYNLAPADYIIIIYQLTLKVLNVVHMQ